MRCFYSEVDCKVCDKRGVCEIFKALREAEDSVEFYEELEDYLDSDEI